MQVAVLIMILLIEHFLDDNSNVQKEAKLHMEFLIEYHSFLTKDTTKRERLHLAMALLYNPWLFAFELLKLMAQTSGDKAYSIF